MAKRGAAASLLTNAGKYRRDGYRPLLPFTQKIRTGYNLPISHVPGPACRNVLERRRISRRYTRCQRSTTVRH